MGYQTNRHEIPNQMLLFTNHLLVFFNIRHILLDIEKENEIVESGDEETIKQKTTAI